MKLLLVSLLALISVTTHAQELLYSEYIPAKERAAWEQTINTMSDHLHVQPRDLMIVMGFETGRSYKPSLVNRYSGATGLIQFIPSTAARMGTTTAKLARMSRIQQLVYVERYFAPYAGKMADVYDLYIVVFAPAFLGQSNSTVLYSSFSHTALGKRRYYYNRGLDKNGDGQITIKEVKNTIKKSFSDADRRGIE